VRHFYEKPVVVKGEVARVSQLLCEHLAFEDVLALAHQGVAREAGAAPTGDELELWLQALA
jgi:hypothetical protein